MCRPPPPSQPQPTAAPALPASPPQPLPPAAALSEAMPPAPGSDFHRLPPQAPPGSSPPTPAAVLSMPAQQPEAIRPPALSVSAQRQLPPPAASYPRPPGTPIAPDGASSDSFPAVPPINGTLLPVAPAAEGGLPVAASPIAAPPVTNGNELEELEEAAAASSGSGNRSLGSPAPQPEAQPNARQSLSEAMSPGLARSSDGQGVGGNQAPERQLAFETAGVGMGLTPEIRRSREFRAAQSTSAAAVSAAGGVAVAAALVGASGALAAGVASAGVSALVQRLQVRGRRHKLKAL
jgi:hypothetical protein